MPRKQAYTEAQLKEALGLYKEEHKESVYIPKRTVVTLKDGTEVKLGSWGKSIKIGNTKISSELRKKVLDLFPNQFENNSKAFSELQLKEALKIYKEEHKNSDHIPYRAVVTLKDGAKVNLGTWGTYIKTRKKSISPELEKEIISLFPTQFEDNRRTYLEEQIREALDIYKRDHKDSDHILRSAAVTLKDGTKVNLGTWGNNVKRGTTRISLGLRKKFLNCFRISSR